MSMFNGDLSGLMRGAVVSILMLLVASATAGDPKTYPGSMGVWGMPLNSSAVPVYIFGSIGNFSETSPMYVELPVLNETDAESIKASEVRVIDQHPTSDITCTIWTTYWQNGQRKSWSGPTKKSTGMSSWVQVLNTGAVAGPKFANHSYVSCLLPPRYKGAMSVIVSYFVNED